MDEEYFACLIECLISGTTELEGLSRKKIVEILRKKNALKARLDSACIIDNDVVKFNIEPKRIENVISKLAYGHAKFEISETQYKLPHYLSYEGLQNMTQDQIDQFFVVTELKKAPEIGCRSMQNMCFTQEGVPIDSWINVQDNIYMYSVTSMMEFLKVRMIIWNYLACEVVWRNFE